MKKLLALLLLVCLLATSAAADVLIELDDAFWKSHQNDCDSLYRSYTANGADGYVTLWDSPTSSKQRENVPNGEQLGGVWHYTDGRGETWCAVSGGGMDENGFEQVRGWVKTTECVPVPDFLSFEEVHGGEFTAYDPAYDHAFDGLDTVVLWKYPGSGAPEATDIDAAWFRENSTPADSFRTCWTDGDGRFWGFVGYCYGIRNTWVCLSDPANGELPADPDVLPAGPELIPASEPPAPSDGVSALTIALVAAVVACTAVLIAVIFGRKRRKRAGA